MENQQPQIVTIDGVEHKLEDMTEQQHMLLNHVADLDRKIGSTKFQMDQLTVGREAFFKMLKEALEVEPAVTDVVAKE
jgi:hypothetical protein